MKSRIIQGLLIALAFVLFQLPFSAPTSAPSETDAVAWDTKVQKLKPRVPADGGRPDRGKNVNWNG